MSRFKPTLILLAVISVAASIAITVTFSDNVYLCWHEKGRTIHFNTGQDPEGEFCPSQYTETSLLL